MKKPDSGPLYSDARLYDLQHKNYMDDLQFYTTLYQETGGPVLELMAGTGRLSLPLAEMGADVTALDYSQDMLELAEKKARSKNITVHLVRADCRTFNLNKTFKLIFIPFNSISHIHEQEALAALFSRVSEHIAENGRFVIDLFVPDFKILLRPDNQRYPVASFDDQEKGRVYITETNKYDPATQINHIKWYYEIDGKKDSRILENNMRMFFPEEMKMLINCNGFKIVDRFGGHNFSAFTKKSLKQLYVCAKNV